ncbi:DNA primase [Ureibacillus massiliensis 4400831 = CIP 108448 = CCUG 49529]|uniref:DNA primase n=1 Tax=Ureibacillus massiliensis 4400831 = CIP 108448 = CCUG 49529 TaxID=1211035 RepID=A0A0A3J0X3_9BACL|nr:DNA primase [Ureibacillus massiliensis]KGR90674.1 DNA primase [Ureibacillus massiliensis 4400831 = CIP 108448 = CCUG 49529]
MTGKIPEQLIEQIRSQSDIVDVISEYVQLTKRGRNWFGLCPFHGENTPSFSVSQEKQIFHCFGCGAGGNAITFIMDIENIPFLDAVSKLGNRVGIQLDIQSSSIDKSSSSYSKSEENMLKAHQFAADFYHHLLLNTEDGEPALNYLLKRGFTKEDIETNGIGWSLPTWDSLSILLQREQYSLDEIVESGLIIKKENDQTYFDRFRDRIMFPIRDEFGKIIAFSGRIIHQSSNEAKYLNSPESPIFHKSQVLYNLDKARGSIRKSGQVILMEGFMDVLAANQAGIYNAVATMGTSLTPQHITKLKRLVEKIIICYDGDNAGWEAAKRASEMLHAEKLKVEIAVLPEKLDPDEYIRKYGAESFKKILDKPHAYIAFIMMHARRNKNFQFENDVLQYIQEVLEHLVGKSPIERDLYIKQLAGETNISEDAIYAQFRKFESDHAKTIKRNYQKDGQTIDIQTRQNKKLTATERAERLLLSHMLNRADVVDRIFVDESQPFVSDEYNAVFVRLVGFYEEHESSDYQRFLEMLDDSSLRKIVMEAALTERDPNHVEAEIADCIKQIKKHRIENEINRLIHDSQEAEKMHEHKRALEIAQKIISLRKSLSAI